MNPSLRNGIASVALASVASIAIASEKFETENIKLSQAEITKSCQDTNTKIGAILKQEGLCEVSTNGGKSWDALEKTAFVLGGTALLVLLASGAIILRKRRSSGSNTSTLAPGLASTRRKSVITWPVILPDSGDSGLSRFSTKAKSLVKSLLRVKTKQNISAIDPELLKRIDNLMDQNIAGEEPEKLLKALLTQGENYAMVARFKLLEIYIARKDPDSFNQYSTELTSLILSDRVAYELKRLQKEMVTAMSGPVDNNSSEVIREESIKTVNGSDTYFGEDGKIYQKNVEQNTLNCLNAIIPESSPIIFPNGDTYFGRVQYGNIQKGTIKTAEHIYVGEFLYNISNDKKLEFAGTKYDLSGTIVEEYDIFQIINNIGPAAFTDRVAEGDRSNIGVGAGLHDISTPGVASVENTIQDTYALPDITALVEQYGWTVGLSTEISRLIDEEIELVSTTILDNQKALLTYLAIPHPSDADMSQEFKKVAASKMNSAEYVNNTTVVELWQSINLAVSDINSFASKKEEKKSTLDTFIENRIRDLAKEQLTKANGIGFHRVDGVKKDAQEIADIANYMERISKVPTNLNRARIAFDNKYGSTPMDADHITSLEVNEGGAVPTVSPNITPEGQAMDFDVGKWLAEPPSSPVPEINTEEVLVAAVETIAPPDIATVIESARKIGTTWTQSDSNMGYAPKFNNYYKDTNSQPVVTYGNNATISHKNIGNTESTVSKREPVVNQVRAEPVDSQNDATKIRMSAKVNLDIQKRIDAMLPKNNTPKRPQMLSAQEVFVSAVNSHNPNVGKDGDTIVDQYKTRKVEEQKIKLEGYNNLIDETFAPTATTVRGKNIFLTLGNEYIIERKGLMNFSLTDARTGTEYPELKSREIVKDQIKMINK